MALGLGAMLLAVSGCATSGKQADSGAGQNKKLKVVASFYPLADFSKNVGKDNIEVQSLIQPGVEPHDWEPTSKDMRTVSQADVIVYNGAGFEPWIEKVLNNVDKSKTLVIDVSKGVELRKAAVSESGHDANAKPGEHAEELDPHFWLDPVNAQKEVQQIAAGLSEKDAQNKDKYAANAKEYNDKLEALNKEFQTQVANAKQKEFVTTHAAFGYLAQRYGLQQIPLMGLAPDAEPSPKEMAEVVKEARAHNVQYIFFETLVSPKVADTVAKEIGAKTLVLNPIEGLSDEELKKGDDYISKMRENLQNLKLALGN